MASKNLYFWHKYLFRPINILFICLIYIISLNNVTTDEVKWVSVQNSNQENNSDNYVPSTSLSEEDISIFQGWSQTRVTNNSDNSQTSQTSIENIANASITNSANKNNNAVNSSTIAASNNKYNLGDASSTSNSIKYIAITEPHDNAEYSVALPVDNSLVSAMKRAVQLQREAQDDDSNEILDYERKEAINDLTQSLYENKATSPTKLGPMKIFAKCMDAEIRGYLPPFVCCTIKNGNYYDKSVWHCNRVPTMVDAVFIRHFIRIDDIIPEIRVRALWIISSIESKYKQEPKGMIRAGKVFQNTCAEASERSNRSEIHTNTLESMRNALKSVLVNNTDSDKKKLNNISSMPLRDICKALRPSDLFTSENDFAIKGYVWFRVEEVSENISKTILESIAVTGLEKDNELSKPEFQSNFASNNLGSNTSNLADMFLLESIQSDQNDFMNDSTDNSSPIFESFMNVDSSNENIQSEHIAQSNKNLLNGFYDGQAKLRNSVTSNKYGNIFSEGRVNGNHLTNRIEIQSYSDNPNNPSSLLDNIPNNSNLKNSENSQFNEGVNDYAKIKLFSMGIENKDEESENIIKNEAIKDIELTRDSGEVNIDEVEKEVDDLDGDQTVNVDEPILVEDEEKEYNEFLINYNKKNHLHKNMGDKILDNNYEDDDTNIDNDLVDNSYGSLNTPFELLNEIISSPARWLRPRPLPARYNFPIKITGSVTVRVEEGAGLLFFENVSLSVDGDIRNDGAFFIGEVTLNDCLEDDRINHAFCRLPGLITSGSIVAVEPMNIMWLQITPGKQGITRDVYFGVVNYDPNLPDSHRSTLTFIGPIRVQKILPGFMLSFKRIGFPPNPPPPAKSRPVLFEVIDAKESSDLFLYFDIYDTDGFINCCKEFHAEDFAEFEVANINLRIGRYLNLQKSIGDPNDEISEQILIRAKSIIAEQTFQGFPTLIPPESASLTNQEVPPKLAGVDRDIVIFQCLDKCQISNQTFFRKNPYSFVQVKIGH